MTINGISTATAPAPSVGETPEKSLGKDAFMQLLVAQLQNQDPTNPKSNEDFIAQLAEFSSLEQQTQLNDQMTQLNDAILGLAVLQQSNALMSQLTDSSALIGQTVKYTDQQTGEQLSGVVDSVKIEDGLAVLSIGGTDVPLLNVTEVTGGGATNDLSDSNEGSE